MVLSTAIGIRFCCKTLSLLSMVVSVWRLESPCLIFWSSWETMGKANTTRKESEETSAEGGVKKQEYLHPSLPSQAVHTCRRPLTNAFVAHVLDSTPEELEFWIASVLRCFFHPQVTAHLFYTIGGIAVALLTHPDLLWTVALRLMKTPGSNAIQDPKARRLAI